MMINAQRVHFMAQENIVIVEVQDIQCQTSL
jgi:hypothetical protein